MSNAAYIRVGGDDPEDKDEIEVRIGEGSRNRNTQPQAQSKYDEQMKNNGRAPVEEIGFDEEFTTGRKTTRWVVLAALAFLMGGHATIFVVYSPSEDKSPGHCPATLSWRGWHSIKYSFIFGDSWTDTAFDPSLYYSQPSSVNPLGNPDFPGHTSANTTNWVGFLTAKHNASELLAFDLAVGGATLDNSIIEGYPNPLTWQIYSTFMPNYASAERPGWKANDTLFALFPGVVDCVMMNGIADSELLESINERLTSRLTNLMEGLYGAGARNFLLLNVPPLERTSQLADGEVAANIRVKYKSDVGTYNKRIEDVAKGLKTRRGDANVFVTDTYSLFNKALDNPKSFETTNGILNTTTPCESYADGTPTTDYFDATCDIPVNQYFWLNGLHPTYPIHDALAEEISKLLSQGPNIC